MGTTVSLEEGDIREVKIFPNPTDESTVIQYSVSSPSKVHLMVYSLNGTLSKILVNENQTAGEHTVPFNTSDLAIGQYYYLLQKENKIYRGNLIISGR